MGRSSEKLIRWGHALDGKRFIHERRAHPQVFRDAVQLILQALGGPWLRFAGLLPLPAQPLCQLRLDVFLPNSPWRKVRHDWIETEHEANVC